jgi:hypothetical protein
MGMNELQADLEVYDQENWLHSSGLPTERHNLLHIMKTTGRIAGHLEAIEDERVPESTLLDPTFVADLVIEALRFANNGGFDLERTVENRLDGLRERSRNRKVE